MYPIYGSFTHVGVRIMHGCVLENIQQNICFEIQIYDKTMFFIVEMIVPILFFDKLTLFADKVFQEFFS